VVLEGSGTNNVCQFVSTCLQIRTLGIPTAPTPVQFVDDEQATPANPPPPGAPNLVR